MSGYDNFWGVVDLTTAEKFPIELLKHQANLIESNTKGILKGEIETITDEEIIYNTLYIIAPNLENYRYALLKTASTSKPYPIFIYDNSRDEKAIKVRHPRKIIKNPFDLNMGILGLAGILGNQQELFQKVEYVGKSIPEPDFNATNYKDFEEAIKTILSSKETSAVVHSLIAQSKLMYKSNASPNLLDS